LVKNLRRDKLLFLLMGCSFALRALSRCRWHIAIAKF
jgi:hypothetical protein